MSEDNHKQLICWRTHSVTATKYPQMLPRRSDGSTKYPNHWGGEMPPQQNDTGEKQKWDSFVDALKRGVRSNVLKRHLRPSMLFNLSYLSYFWSVW